MPDHTPTSQSQPPEASPPIPLPELTWHDAAQLHLAGKAWPVDAQAPYARLPQSASRRVHRDIWTQGRCSAGVCVHFVTDASDIWARWQIDSADPVKPFQTRLAQQGLDLYVQDGDRWLWAGAGLPSPREDSTAWLAGPFPPESRSFCLALPLGAAVMRCEIGIAPSATIQPAPADAHKPVVVYGSSIVQGAGASRPGMAYPAILARRVGRPVMNLGLAGAAWMDRETVALLSEIDAAAFVLDCLPNMDAQLVADRTDPVVRTLRESQPQAHIVLVEDRTQPRARYSASHFKAHQDRRTALRYAHERLTDSGLDRLHYLHGEQLLGSDLDATVDGSHPSDLGAVRIVDAIAPVLTDALPDGACE